MIEVDAIHAGYGRAEALHGVSLNVSRGEVLAIIGPNGAGKTTLMGAIAGIRPVWDGNIRLDGVNITHAKAADRVRTGIVLCPEGRKIFSTLTVEENLKVGATALTARKPATGRRDPPDVLQRAYDRFPILGERRHQKGGTLSGGQQQMLAIARSLASEPEFLLLDEPSLGLAPSVIERVYEMLQTLHGDGLGIILVEEGAHRALDFADRAIVLSGGKVVIHGSASEVAKNRDLVDSYFGSTET